MKKSKIIVIAVLLVATFSVIYELKPTPSSAVATEAGMVNYDYTITNPKSTKTDKTIQSIIDLAANNGGGDVYIPAGRYFIKNTIIVKPTVRLQLSYGTRLIPSSNVNVVELKKNSSINGGMIYTYGYDNFSKSAIFLSGEEEFTGSINAASISDMQLIGQTGAGNGLFFHAVKGSDHVSFVQVNNLNINGFNKAIHLKTEEVKKPNKIWVNANTFSQIAMNNPTYGIYIDGHFDLPNEISGNHFSGIQIQTSPDTKQGIYIKGTKNYVQAMIWDYHRGTDAIVLDKNSYRNQLYTNVQLDDEAYIDSGRENIGVSSR